MDVLHNNVGFASMGGPVELTEEEWQRAFDLNLKTIFLACKHTLPGHAAARQRCDRQHLVDRGDPVHRLPLRRYV